MHVKINLHKTKTKHIRVQLIEWIILIFLHACVHAIHIHCIYRLNFAMPSSETNGRPIILRKLSHARLAVVAMWYRQSNISDNDEDLAWFQLRKLKKNLKKSYQSEISAWLFHPNIWSQSCRFQWTFSVAHNTNNRSLYIFSVQPAKTFIGRFKSSHSLFTWNLCYLCFHLEHFINTL